MKLHLPKALFTAVMALFAVSQTAWADWDSSNPDTFYYTGQETEMTTADYTGAATTLYFKAASDGSGNTGTIDSVSIADGDKLIMTGYWQNASANFESLTVGQLNAGTGAQLEIAGNQGNTSGEQHITINAMTGTLSSLKVNSKGYLDVNGAADITDMSIDGGTVNLAGSGVSVTGTLGLNNAAQLNFKKAEGADATTYTVGSFAMQTNPGAASGAITIDSGVTVNASALNNGWGLGNLTVDGTLSVSGELKYATGGVTNNISGSGSIQVGSLSLVNWGTYKISVSELTVTGNLKLAGDGWGTASKSELTGGILKVQGTVENGVDAHNMTINGGSLVLQGGGTFADVTLALSAGSLVQESGDTTISNTFNMTGGQLSVKGGTMSVSSLSPSGGAINVSGGALTITNLTSTEALVTSVSGGELNITNLTATGAFAASVTGEGSLNITNVSVNVESWSPTSSDIKYYVYEGDNAVESTTGNGFYANASTYLLFDGYEWNGTVDGFTTKHQDGDTYLIGTGTITRDYYINTGEETVSTALGADSYVVKGGTMNISGTMNSSDIEYTGGAITLADADTTLVLDGSDNSGALMALVTGEAGTIKVTGNTTMTGAAQAQGKLAVEGATLTVALPRVNNDAGPDKNDNTWLSSFNSIELNNAVVKYHGSTTTWKNVTVGEDGATIKIRDMDSGKATPSPNKFLTLDGTTTLNGALTIESSWDGAQTWKYGVNIALLTGTGDLTIKGTQTAENEYNYVTAKLNDTYAGSITVQNGTGTLTKLTLSADGDINLKGLTLTGGDKAQVDLSGVLGTKTLGTVAVGEGSTLNLQGVIGSMTATGAGGISMADGTSITGTVSIANAMTMSGTVSNSGNLTLNGSLSDASDTAKGKLVVANSGQLTINSSNNTYSGGTEVKGGATLVVGEQTSGSLGTGEIDVTEKSTLKLGWLSSLAVDTINLSGESTIDLENASSSNSLNTLNATINIEGSNTIKAGINGNNAAVAGSIKGNGTLNLDNKGYSNTWLLQSTISDKSATEKLAISSNSDAIVSGTNTYTGGTTITGRTLTTASEKALGEGKVTVDGGTLQQTAALKVTALEYKSGTVNNNGQALEVGSLTVGSTPMAMAGNGTTTVTDTLTVSNANAFTMEGALTLSDGITINLTGLDIVAGKTSYTLATAANGVNLQNYTITGLDLTGTMYEGYRMTISAMDSNAADGISLLAGEGNTNTNALVLTLEQNTTELTQVTVTGAQGYDAADNVLTLTTNIADIADYSGIASTLAATVTDSLWEQLVEQYGIGTLVNIALVDAAGNYFDLDGADNEGTGDDVALTINGIGVNAPAPTYSAVGNGAAVGPYVTSYIPEPTTGTLSILALAGLMIRRRRR